MNTSISKVKIKRGSKCKHSLNCFRSAQAAESGGGGAGGSPPNTKADKKFEVVSIESSTERQRRKNLSLPLPENGVTTPVAADALASPNDPESGRQFLTTLFCNTGGWRSDVRCPSFHLFVHDIIENSVEDYSSSRMVSSVVSDVVSNFKHKTTTLLLPETGVKG